MKRSLKRLDTKYILFLVIISLLFTSYLLTKINHLGDQPWFANQAKLFHHDYLRFAIERYQSWSSRLFIESLTMLFSANIPFFKLALFAHSFAFLLSVKTIFQIRPNSLLAYVFPFLLFLIFPTTLLMSAGLIPTVVNYFFPICWAVSAFSLLRSEKKYLRFLAYMLLLLSCMQEQIAFVLLLLGITATVWDYFKTKKWKISLLLVSALGGVGILSTILSPGNKARIISEAMTWYPNFHSVSTFEKIYLGFLDTNRTLFISTLLPSLFVLYAIIFLLGIVKKNWLAIAGVMVSIVTILIFQFRLWTPFNQIILYLQENQTFSVTILSVWTTTVFIGLICLIPVMVLAISRDKIEAAKIVVLLVVGYMSRMLVSFSPTIYASETRTYVVFSSLIYFAVILLLSEYQYSINTIRLCIKEKK